MQTFKTKYYCSQKLCHCKCCMKYSRNRQKSCITLLWSFFFFFFCFCEFRSQWMSVLQLSRVKQVLTFKGSILLHTSPIITMILSSENIFHRKSNDTLNILELSFSPCLYVFCIYCLYTLYQVNMITAPKVNETYKL